MTMTPAARSCRPPPPAASRGGSRQAYTTRRNPAAMISCEHGHGREAADAAGLERAVQRGRGQPGVAGRHLGQRDLLGVIVRIRLTGEPGREQGAVGGHDGRADRVRGLRRAGTAWTARWPRAASRRPPQRGGARAEAGATAAAPPCATAGAAGGRGPRVPGGRDRLAGSPRLGGRFAGSACPGPAGWPPAGRRRLGHGRRGLAPRDGGSPALSRSMVRRSQRMSSAVRPPGSAGLRGVPRAGRLGRGPGPIVVGRWPARIGRRARVRRPGMPRVPGLVVGRRAGGTGRKAHLAGPALPRAPGAQITSCLLAGVGRALPRVAAGCRVPSR